jgi:hypothetical protein
VKSRLLFLITILVLAGCAPRELVKKQEPVSGPVVSSATPAGPPTPVFKDLRTPVTDLEYQQALLKTGAGEVNARNLDDYYMVEIGRAHV